MRGPELRILCIATIATLFAISASAATTETTGEELANWCYVVQSLIYGGYKTEGLSFYADYEYGWLSVAISTSG